MNNHARVSINGLKDVGWPEALSILAKVFKARKAMMFTTYEYVILPMPSNHVRSYMCFFYTLKGIVAWFAAKYLRVDVELTYWVYDLDCQLWRLYMQRFSVEVEGCGKERVSYLGRTYHDRVIFEGNHYWRQSVISHDKDGLPMLDSYDFETLFVNDYAYQLAPLSIFK